MPKCFNNILTCAQFGEAKYWEPFIKQGLNRQRHADVYATFSKMFRKFLHFYHKVCLTHIPPWIQCKSFPIADKNVWCVLMGSIAVQEVASVRLTNRMGRGCNKKVEKVGGQWKQDRTWGRWQVAALWGFIRLVTNAACEYDFTASFWAHTSGVCWQVGMKITTGTRDLESCREDGRMPVSKRCCGNY